MAQRNRFVSVPVKQDHGADTDWADGEAVREFQGLYGPFTLSERVLQKIWLRGDFLKEGLRTVAGQVLEILHPGQWNLQEGPDFKDARLRIGGEEIRGDVEIHFSQGDWWQHNHAGSARFDRVILHVVLHPPGRKEPPARTLGGSMPEVLVLLPRLNRDLESYAADEALLEMEQVNELEWVASFLRQPVEERVESLRAMALLRWKQKVSYARKRLDAAGWDEACHQLCLEVLGYRRNRGPMGRIALRVSLAAMQTEIPPAGDLYASEAGNWKLAGLRPSNHPLKRIAQYAALMKANPAWPSELERVLEQFLTSVPAGMDGAGARRTLRLGDLRAVLEQSVFASQIRANRLNTLVCDALLPLAAARGLPAAECAWMHWYPGDSPDALKRFLRQSGVVDGKRHPHANGWNQGALALFMNA